MYNLTAVIDMLAWRPAPEEVAVGLVPARLGLPQDAAGGIGSN